ncbi:AAA family ATPase [Methylobacterium frigidaeris]|uniref:ATPase AAA-type core domain-containing protein n=1 Tax=Methylobacterium frigidaeris TaxID=2038277 RepID=A0AA37HD18_9HYPH|nr:AAA family ATPase [Methylobacterium frigidaeris]GJD63554.1 hypothetical protein MPEAHAMD_3724 [Methylobacterium frigidaeris]
MPIHRLAVSGDRWLRNIVLGLDRLTVVTGANGSGKSSLYRALRLLAEVAQGRAVPSLALEGGFSSALWAGPETFGRRVLDGTHRVEGTVRRHPVDVKLGFSDDEYGYAIALGLPAPSHEGTVFAHDPEIKAESVWTGPIIGRANIFAERSGPLPRRAGPAARPQIGTRTPVLARRRRRRPSSRSATAKPSTRPSPKPLRERPSRSRAAQGHVSLELRQHGLLRPLRGAELSDGTLRHILLAAALLSPRPPDLMVLNEPETSLHADLLPPLAGLIARASGST